MKRNLRTSFITFGFIVIAVLLFPSIGSALRYVNASDQVGEVTVEPQPTDAPAETPLPSESTLAPNEEQPTEASPALPTEAAPTESTSSDLTATVEPGDSLPTAEATDEANPEANETLMAEATLEPEVTAEATETLVPEATLEPEITAEATETLVPEATLEPEMTPEVTETPLPTQPEFALVVACTESGITFLITNIGTDMESPMSFKLTLDEAANAAAPTPPAGLTPSEIPVEFTLLAGESTIVVAGFGQPNLVLDGVLFQPEAPCLPPVPPILEVSSVCTFETGVTFTVINTGGAMPAEQALTITFGAGDPVTSMFFLGTNETAIFDAGYGQPSLSIGEQITTVEVPCDAPTAISGSVWNDVDGDAIRSASETGIAGVTVTLVDALGAFQSAVTAADGSYIFGNLHVGDYSVSVDTATLSTDYVQSYPSVTSVGVAAVGTNNVADFGFVANPTASVTGTVWLETSNYGVRDTGEMGIGGVVVELVDHTGIVTAVAPVDATTGTYVFLSILSGDYTVRLAQATLFTPNGVTWNSDDTVDYETPITLTTGQSLTSIDFGLVGTY